MDRARQPSAELVARGLVVVALIALIAMRGPLALPAFLLGPLLRPSWELLTNEGLGPLAVDGLCLVAVVWLVVAQVRRLSIRHRRAAIVVALFGHPDRPAPAAVADEPDLPSDDELLEAAQAMPEPAASLFARLRTVAALLGERRGSARPGTRTSSPMPPRVPELQAGPMSGGDPR